MCKLFYVTRYCYVFCKKYIDSVFTVVFVFFYCFESVQNFLDFHLLSHALGMGRFW